MPSANFPNRPYALRAEAVMGSQSAADNRSGLDWQLWIDKTGYSPTYSGNPPTYRAMKIDGTVVGTQDGAGFDFRGPGPWLILSGTSLVYHNPDGTKTAQLRAEANYDILGATSVDWSYTFPPIARNPPPAPTPLGIDQITRTSMRYQFRSAGDGGSPLLNFEAQCALDEMWGVAAAFYGLSGVVTASGLYSGRRYAWRSRGINAAGPGPWSPVLSAYTLSGGLISTGSQWVTAEVLISDGTRWVPAEVLISDGSKWLPAG